jgi:hypothetical protein
VTPSRRVIANWPATRLVTRPGELPPADLWKLELGTWFWKTVMLASEDSDPPSTGGGLRASKRASARAPGTPPARAEAPDPPPSPSPPWGLRGSLARVGHCPMAAVAAARPRVGLGPTAAGTRSEALGASSLRLARPGPLLAESGFGAHFGRPPKPRAWQPATGPLAAFDSLSAGDPPSPHLAHNAP